MAKRKRIPIPQQPSRICPDCGHPFYGDNLICADCKEVEENGWDLDDPQDDPPNRNICTGEYNDE